MYVLENPVLQRELLVNLRMARAFVLLFFYQAALALVVYFAWPRGIDRLDLSSRPDAARVLSDLFFMGQYILASLMAPSFAAGTITGEKERKTYEMLLASPLRPAAIVLGKMVASLTHLAVLIFASLPIIMLCLPLGGVSLYEVLAAYLAACTTTLEFMTGVLVLPQRQTVLVAKQVLQQHAQRNRQAAQCRAQRILRRRKAEHPVLRCADLQGALRCEAILAAYRHRAGLLHGTGWQSAE